MRRWKFSQLVETRHNARFANLKLWSKYDVYGILPSIDNVDEGDADGNVGNNNNESRNRNKRKYWKQETLQNMHDVLSQALTDRARLIRVMWEKRSKNSWKERLLLLR